MIKILTFKEVWNIFISISRKGILYLFKVVQSDLTCQIKCFPLLLQLTGDVSCTLLSCAVHPTNGVLLGKKKSEFSYERKVVMMCSAMFCNVDENELTKANITECKCPAQPWNEPVSKITLSFHSNGSFHISLIHHM